MINFIKNLPVNRNGIYLQSFLRAINSVGSECLLYTEEVGGSSPSSPTTIKLKPLFINDLQGIYFFCCQIYCPFRAKKQPYSSSLVSTKLMLMLIRILAFLNYLLCVTT
jgi:hypothetical protein